MAAESPADAVSRRELDQRIAAMQALLDERVNAQQAALGIQTVEIARRLDELNHAHKIAMENWARSLPRENFDLAMRDWDRWRESTNLTIQHAQGAVGLIRWMGLLGVIALLLQFLRMADLVP